MFVQLGSGGCFPRTVTVEARGTSLEVQDAWDTGRLRRVRVRLDDAALARFVTELRERSRALPPPAAAAPSSVPPPGPPPWFRARLPDARGALVDHALCFDAAVLDWVRAQIDTWERLPGARVKRQSPGHPVTRSARLGRRVMGALGPWLVLYALIGLVALGYWLRGG